MENRIRTSSDAADSYSDHYWATDPPEDLTLTLMEKTRKFKTALRSSLYWERVLRNLAYVHGQFFQAGTDCIDMEIKIGGPQGEILHFASNQFRNLIEHYFQLAARDKLEMKARATNSDDQSLAAAKISDGILEYYRREKQMEEFWRSAAWQSLIFARGFVLHEWDNNAGSPDALSGQPTGDIVFRNPLANEVTWNNFRPWEECQWVTVKTYQNKWDLASQFTKYEEEIVSTYEEDNERILLYRSQPEIIKDDLIPVYKFFHKRTSAVPTGRFLLFVKNQYLMDSELPYKDLPISSISAGEWVGQGTGWTPAFSLQGPQEMLNGELTAIATNHATCATQKMWVPEGAEKVKSVIMKGGVQVLSGPAKPEPLPLLTAQPDIWKFAEYLERAMGLLIGISGTTRGEPPTGTTAGNAMALLDAKSVQFATSFVRAYGKLGEDVSTSLIRTLRQYGTNPRIITIMGKTNQPEQMKFTGEDLQEFDRVVAESVNAMSKTQAGKEAIAEKLISLGAVQNPKQLFTVYEKGTLEPMFKADEAQLTVVSEENEALQAGQPVSAIRIDNHIMHIKEHHAVLGSKTTRSNPKVVNFVLAHILEHEQLLSLPDVQRDMAALGYPVPPQFTMPMGMPMGASPQAMGGKPPTETENTAQAVSVPPGTPPSVSMPKEPELPPGAPKP
jgi:hypothetical protein